MLNRLDEDGLELPSCVSFAEAGDKDPKSLAICLMDLNKSGWRVFSPLRKPSVIRSILILRMRSS